MLKLNRQNGNERVFPDMTSGIELNSVAEPNMEVFDETEVGVLQDIVELFRNTKADEISNISHEETGWLDNYWKTLTIFILKNDSQP